MSNTFRDQEGLVITEKRQKIEEPSLYKVLLHNDDYTTMDFVIHVLEVVFHKSNAEATTIMMQVHQKGIGVAGIYTKEIAETKTAIVNDMARKNEFPLKSSMETV